MSKVKQNIYENAKIYKITSFSKPELVYYGSTCQSLKRRLRQHKTEMKIGKKEMASKQILELDDAYIVLVEEYPCQTKEDLFKREAEYISNNICVNKTMPYVSPEQQKENMKKYLEQNKEIIRQKDQARHKIWYQKSKEKVAEKYQKNKLQIQEKAKKMIICECGAEVMKCQMARHKKTDKHSKLLKIQTQSNEIPDNMFLCECGDIGMKYHFARHKKSEKHVKFVQSNTENKI